MRMVRLKQRQQIVLLCHGCGFKHHLEDRFCARCGLPLFELARAEPQPRPQAPHLNRGAAIRAGVIAVLVAALGAGIVHLRRPAELRLAGLAIGDTPAKVEKVLGKPALAPTPMNWKPGHRAVMWHYDPDLEAGGVPNLTVTFIDGHVRRVAVLDRHFATADGLRVGDTLAKARRIYGTAIEEDATGSLVPFKFICQGDVVKVIVEQGSPKLLAIGIETPDDIRLSQPRAPAPSHPQGSPFDQGLPYLGDPGGTSL